MFTDKPRQDSLLQLAFDLGPLGALAGKAAGKKVRLYLPSNSQRQQMIRLCEAKNSWFKPPPSAEALAKASSSKRLKDLGTAFLAEPEQPPASDANDSVSELEKLVSMKEKGLLSDEEFTAAKAKLLGL